MATLTIQSVHSNHIYYVIDDSIDALKYYQELQRIVRDRNASMIKIKVKSEKSKLETEICIPAQVLSTSFVFEYNE